jgi:hypothetical protein
MKRRIKNQGRMLLEHKIISYDQEKEATKFGETQMLRKKNCHLRQSSNELKINDPFEENKSHGTEYLKKKINFSEGKTEREALIDYLYEPIKIID